MKFIRNYEIRIKTPDGVQLTIAPPFSCVFDVSRDVMSSVNNANVTLYNLAPSTRGQVYKDKYVFDKYWQMIILAGYGDNELYEIFRGNIQEAFSYKKGTEWITEITGYDGSYAIQNGYVSETVAKNTSLKDAVTRVIHTMPETLAGVLGTPVTAGTKPRGEVLMGSSYDVLQNLTGGQAYIDGETVNVLAKDDVVSGDVFVLDGENIAETPKRREQFLEVSTTVLCPEIRVGYICELKSAAGLYNGQYKVYGVKHSATISGAQCGDASSVISLYKGAAAFVEVG